MREEGHKVGSLVIRQATTYNSVELVFVNPPEDPLQDCWGHIPHAAGLNGAGSHSLGRTRCRHLRLRLRRTSPAALFHSILSRCNYLAQTSNNFYLSQAKQRLPALPCRSSGAGGGGGIIQDVEPPGGSAGGGFAVFLAGRRLGAGIGGKGFDKDMAQLAPATIVLKLCRKCCADGKHAEQHVTTNSWRDMAAAPTRNTPAAKLFLPIALGC